MGVMPKPSQERDKGPRDAVPTTNTTTTTRRMAMAITVLTDETHYTHEKGVDWYIDDECLLYVRDSTKKHIATYHSRKWNSVTEGEPRLSEEQREEHETRRIEAEAMAVAKAEVLARRGQL